MDERSKRAQMERKRRIRRKKQRRRILISALVEVLILAVLALAFCWERADLSGIHDEDHDCNCGAGSIFRSGS